MLDEHHTSTNPKDPKPTNQTFLEEKTKKLKASLIIMANHKTFMNTCLHTKTPHVPLGRTTHIPFNQRDRKRMDGYTSVKLLRTLIRHHPKEEKNNLELILAEVTTHLVNISDNHLEILGHQLA